MIRWIQALGAGLCLALALVSAVPALADAVELTRLGASQLGGPAVGTDFLNLYAGADLALHSAADIYDYGAQHELQRRLTASQSAIVPFFLPPYATPLLVWLALLPYGVAYVVWLSIGLACLMTSAVLIAPGWGGRFYPLVWIGLCLLFLPAFLALAEGQTSAVMLLAFAWLSTRLRSRTSSGWLLAIGALAWTLKPQFAPCVVVALLLARRGDAVACLVVMLGALSALAVQMLGPVAIGGYLHLSQQKFQEVFVADPTFLAGPTLLNASQRLLGLGWPAQLLAAALSVVALVALGNIWWRGLAHDDAALAQLAALPVASIICAPYALAYELTTWLASFWLLWVYTRRRPVARAMLVWLTAGVWLAGDVAVVSPVVGGADLAALLGLWLLLMIAWLVRRHVPVPASAPAGSLAAALNPLAPGVPLVTR